MTRDPKRTRLEALIHKNDLSLASVSVAIGRNKTCPPAMPAPWDAGGAVVPGHRYTGQAAGLCDPSELRHETRPPRALQPHTRRHWSWRNSLVAIPEITVNAQADANTIAEAYAVRESASWRIPEAFLLYESDADPSGVRILKAEGDAMAPELQAGDRIVVDPSRRWPTLGELFVLWDGNAIVIKRYECVWDSGPPTVRLHSYGRFHPPYTCLASEVKILGKVLWAIRTAQTGDQAVADRHNGATNVRVNGATHGC